MEILALIAILFFAVILHECAHGYVANMLGDPTAKLAGRLTLNPFKHVDPVGTVILPGILMIMRAMGYNVFLFGWAKPVPVNFANLKNPKRDMIWVGLAGPAVNIVLAVFFSLLIKDFGANPAYKEIFTMGVFINLMLAVFNMIPIPPLDGSRLVMGLLPNSLLRPYMALEPYGIVIVIVLLSSGFLDGIILPAMLTLARLIGVGL